MTATKEHQPELFGESEIDFRFGIWIEEHPVAEEKFIELAVEAKRAGFKRYSADAIVHRLRWHFDVEMRLEGGFKWNDHFTSRLARRAMERVPELEGFFELRRLRSRCE